METVGMEEESRVQGTDWQEKSEGEVSVDLKRLNEAELWIKLIFEFIINIMSLLTRTFGVNDVKHRKLEGWKLNDRYFVLFN